MGTTCFTKVVQTGVVALMLTAFSGLKVPADERSAGPPPLAVFSVTGLERVLEDVDYVFAAADRPDAAQIVRGVLAALGDLRGLDRSRPLGAMLLLQPGLAPRPVVVGFVPVQDIDELRQTFSIGIEIRREGGTDDRFEIILPQRTLYGRLIDGYGFIAAEREILNRPFPDPMELVRGETAEFDAAASIRLADMPEGMKILVIDYMRAKAAAELQQRDRESDDQFALRKLSTENALESLEQGLMGGRALTLGWTLSDEKRTAALELRFGAKPDSTLATELDRIASRSGPPVRAITEVSPLSLAVSWTLDERSRAVLEQGLKVAEREAEGRYSRESIRGAVGTLYEALQATVRDRHVHLFAQLTGDPPGPLALVGAVKLQKADDVADALPVLLKELARTPGVVSVQLTAERHGCVELHRLTRTTETPEQERLFGANPAVYVGVGSERLWFAYGGAKALEAVQQAIDRVSQAPEAEPAEFRVPLRLALRAAPWIATLGTELGSSPAQRELVRDAFSRGQDTLRVEATASGGSLRVRFELEEGFVRLLGLAVVRQMDRR